jgi:hypothetical protein
MESYEYGQTILYELPNFKGTGIGFGKVGYGYSGTIPSQLLNTIGSLKVGPETEVTLTQSNGTSTKFVNELNDVKRINSIVGNGNNFISIIVKPVQTRLVEGFGYNLNMGIIVNIIIVCVIIYLTYNIIVKKIDI